MTAADAARLRRSAGDARRRLAEEGLPGVGGILDALDEVVAEAVRGPASEALAVYASRALTLVVRLPLPVRDRVVIDPTFATRDLVRALHRTPRHVVLALSGRQARLFEGVSGVLRPVVSGPFPFRRETPPDRSRHHGTGRLDRRGESRDTAPDTDFLSDVDQALGTYLRLHPAPLVLVGPVRTLAAFRRLSRNLGRLAGAVPGHHGSTSPGRLAELVRPVLDTYLHSREQEALGLLERRMNTGHAVSGLAAAWLAARYERPEMLVVEDGHYVPARLSPDGDLLLPAEDVEHPDVVDDAVDELLELVIQRGGWVALARDGVLAAHDGVALTLRGGTTSIAPPAASRAASDDPAP
jgi:hypothetical protein